MPSADPQFFARGQYPQSHPDAGFSFCGYCVIEELRIQQMDSHRRASLLHGIAAGGFGKPDIAFDIPGVRGTDIY